MRHITFLTPTGESYVATAQREPQDTAVPHQPGPEYVFDREAMEWHIPLPSLPEAREQAHAAIKAARDTRINEGGLIWNGYLVSIDKDAMDRMTGKAVEFIAGTIAETRWKMSDGEYAVLDQQTFFTMFLAAGEAVQAHYAAEEAKRRTVDALPDAAAVLDWLNEPDNLRQGWPLNEEGDAA